MTEALAHPDIPIPMLQRVAKELTQDVTQEVLLFEARPRQ
jgi:hypothetical protein